MKVRNWQYAYERPRKERSSEKKESKELTCGKTEKKARIEPAVAVWRKPQIQSSQVTKP